MSTWRPGASLALAAACAALAAVGTACMDTPPCVHRGQSSVYSGSVAYTGQIAPTGIAGGPMQELNGAVATSITVDDFFVDDSCSGNPVEFTTHVGDCALWTLADDDSGTASVEDGQSCDLPTSGGVATVSIQQGTLIAGAQAQLTLSGNVTAYDDAGTVGYLQWSFAGQ